MTHPAYLRDKARELRVEKRLSLDEIAERLALPKTTIWYWISDLPLARPRKENAIAAGEASRIKHQALRDAAYARGLQSWPILSADPTFRDFVGLYIAEGCKRSRNQVSVANSDPAVMCVCVRWLRKLSAHPVRYWIQYHADQDLDELRAYWGEVLGIDGAWISMQRKSNSNQLAGRSWRSQYGVLTARVDDTYLRARLQAWIDCLRATWT